jgi:predicted RNA-binding Zn-ribbon protein involved in translation (DUF1610 family)
MSEHRRISLKTISVISAPPVLNASDHTIDFACGKCGTVLLHAEENQVHNVTIYCVNCGSYNTTNL